MVLRSCLPDALRSIAQDFVRPDTACRSSGGPGPRRPQERNLALSGQVQLRGYRRARLRLRRLRSILPVDALHHRTTARWSAGDRSDPAPPGLKVEYRWAE